MLVIKVYIGGKPFGYLSKESWGITEHVLKARIMDEKEITEVEKMAERFENSYDEDCCLECKIVKREIEETLL